MELKIRKEKEAPLLSRKEIAANIEFKGPTPSKGDVKKQLVSALNADEKLIVVKKIFTSFGSEAADVVAYQYYNEEDMKKTEPREKEKKTKAKKEEGAKEEEEHKEEKKEEPKEEKKETKKEEKKEIKKEEPKKEAPKEEHKKHEKK